MERFAEEIRIISEWASNTEEIKSVYLFGSRVRGDNRPDSDLDVAIEVESIKPEETPLDIWYCEKANWENELIQKITRYVIDLERFDPNGNPAVKSGIERGNILIYEKRS